MKKFKALILSGLCIVCMSFTGYAADLNSPKANNIVQQVSSSEMYKGAQIKPGVPAVKVNSEYKNS